MRGNFVVGGALTDPRPYDGLTPELLQEAIASLGVATDGRLFALNSYENRVYLVGCDAKPPVVAKFYRPGRWSDAAILEEHGFAAELAARDLPVARALEFKGTTLHHMEGFRFALFDYLQGRAPELGSRDALGLIGRTLGRIHAVGALSEFQHRPDLDVERLGWQARDAVLAHPDLDERFRDRYAAASEELLVAIEQVLDAHSGVRWQRIHGDCHLGNVLWNDHGPVFVDLDDCMMGPAVQDLWMFATGNEDEQRGAWELLLGGYRQFAHFDRHELALVDALRALRMLHHGGWIAARWRDPAFPRAFPWFGEARYWEQHLSDLAAERDPLRGEA
ncbi:MAG: serine/threonine protein kinase [Steroidobacteraceae bacterium]